MQWMYAESSLKSKSNNSSILEFEDRVEIAKIYCEDLLEGSDADYLESFFEKYDIDVYDLNFSTPFIEKFQTDLDKHGMLVFDVSERRVAGALAVLLFGETYIREVMAVMPAESDFLGDAESTVNINFENCVNVTLIDDDIAGAAKVLFNELFGLGKVDIDESQSETVLNFYSGLIDDKDYKWFGVAGLIKYSGEALSCISDRFDILERVGFKNLESKLLEVSARFSCTPHVDLLGEDPLNLFELEKIICEFDVVLNHIKHHCDVDESTFNVFTILGHVDPLNTIECLQALCSEVLNQDSLSKSCREAMFVKVQSILQAEVDIDKDSFLTLMRVLSTDNYRKIELESEDPSAFFDDTKRFVARWGRYDLEFPLYVIQKEGYAGGLNKIYNILPSIILRVFKEGSILDKFSFSKKLNYKLIRKLSRDPNLVIRLQNTINKLKKVIGNSSIEGSPLRVFGYYERLHRKLTGKSIFKKPSEVLKKLRKNVRRAKVFGATEIDCQRRSVSERKAWEIVSKARSMFFKSAIERYYRDELRAIANVNLDETELSREIENAIKIYSELELVSSDEEDKKTLDLAVKYLRRVIVSGVKGEAFPSIKSKKNKAFMKKLKAHRINPDPWVNGFSKVYEYSESSKAAIGRMRRYYLDEIDELCIGSNISINSVISNFDNVKDEIGDPKLVKSLRLKLQRLRQLELVSSSETFEQKIEIYLETVPLKRLLVGVNVDNSCYAPGGTASYASALIAMNINFGVAWASLENGEIIGRKIYSINDSLGLNHYLGFTRGDWMLEGYFRQFSDDLGKAMKIKLHDSGTTTPVLTPNWTHDESKLPF